MRRNILLLVLIIIFSYCSERDLRNEFKLEEDKNNNTNFFDTGYEVLDTGDNKLEKCEDYRCIDYDYVNDSMYIDKDTGYYYLLSYSKLTKEMGITKKHKNEYGDFGNIWYRDLEDAEGLSEDMHIIYVDKDENNFYLSSCKGWDNCKILELIRYEKYKDKEVYKKVFHYYKELINDRIYAPLSITFDSYGNTYVSGEFIKGIDFGNGQVVKNSEECIYTGNPQNLYICYTDVFLVKINPEGIPLWSKVLGKEGDDYVGQIAAYEDDLFVSIISPIEKTVDLDRCPLASGEGKIVKIGSDGNIKWSRFLAENICSFYGPVVDRSGNIYIGGRFDLHSTYIDADKYKDLFIAKFDKNGEFIWGRKFESDMIGSSQQIETSLKYVYVVSMYIDSFLNIYTTGIYGVSKKYPSGNTYEYRYDFISKYDKDGNRIGFRRLERNGLMYGFYGINYVNPDKGLLYLIVGLNEGNDYYIDNCIIQNRFNEYLYYLLSFGFEVCE